MTIKKFVPKREHKINDEIKSRIIILISESGEKLGDFPLLEAQIKAEEQGLDLVQLNMQEEKAICKIMDYGKFCFENKKNKSKSNKIIIKEIQIRPNIDEGDFQIKIKKIKEFLEDDCKVNIILKFRGREIIHKEIGLKVFERIIENLNTLAKIEKEAKIEGKRALMVIAPKK